MTDSNDKFREKIRLIAITFVEKLPEKINRIESLWDQLKAEWNTESLRTLHRTTHGLSDSSKALGFSEIENVVSILEQLFKDLVQNEVSASDEEYAEIDQQILKLKQVAADATPDQAQNQTHQAVLSTDNATIYSEDSDNANQIFVVDDDLESAQELAMQLSYYDYEVQVFDKINEFKQAIINALSPVVLINIELNDDKAGGIKLMKAVQKDLEQPAQVIFISAYDDLTSRLGAVRVGGAAYFTKPINSTELLDKLDSLTTAQPQDYFRVLIVDDSSALLAYHTTVLEQAGMTVKTVLRPIDVMDALREFNPDLILIDVYMPECSGIELAKVIRQLGSFVSIPIIYLSSENDFNTQIEAMSLAGDDFLVKPIEPRQLVTAVESRILRDRLLRSYMERDSLTGLFNHTSITEQFDREVVRSKRLSTPLSFVMVDIDYFKKVNDTYGHSAGDRVIKSLARLLKQRLRGTDIVGRYGGEEFAVIMTDTDAPSAVKVMDEIRQVFSRLIHVDDGREFSVSFSCGIADIVHFSDPVSMGEAAEEALQLAKQKGRDQVVFNETALSSTSASNVYSFDRNKKLSD